LEAAFLIAILGAASAGFVIGVYASVRAFMLFFALALTVPITLSISFTQAPDALTLSGVFGGFAWMCYGVGLVAAGLGRRLRRASGLFPPAADDRG